MLTQFTDAAQCHFSDPELCGENKLQLRRELEHLDCRPQFEYGVLVDMISDMYGSCDWAASSVSPLR